MNIATSDSRRPSACQPNNNLQNWRTHAKKPAILIGSSENDMPCHVIVLDLMWRLRALRAPVLASRRRLPRLAHLNFSTPSSQLSEGITKLQNGFPIYKVFAALTTLGIAATAYGVCGLHALLISLSITNCLWIDISSTPCLQCGPKSFEKTCVPESKLSTKITSSSAHAIFSGVFHFYLFDNSSSSDTCRTLCSAWEACLTLPKEDLGNDPWLKISGIACKLGEVLEDSNQSETAYDIYAQCCNLMQGEAAASRLSAAERRRAIALSMHLGELAELLGKPEKDEEHWLVWNVEELLRIYKENSGEEALRHLDAPHEQELGLPIWTEKDEFEIALEALARYYAKQGNAE